ncbi:hypothetical protein [Cryptosporangium arvum]|uniref:Uncharacterized protein n=1 Tax=Cryptosporangium arvum DSM 44712 TaxID=927661 RepID=A0A010YIC6_9ACTN|nr:hypothetical protein [Cryptosporangium arvum]EXG80015.1 hypothetical protein CryarDRAFT_1074 [Cryptosporangium arvum DSM 44712]
MSEQPIETLAEYARRLVDDMPPLRPEQRVAIRQALHGVGDEQHSGEETAA